VRRGGCGEPGRFMPRERVCGRFPYFGANQVISYRSRAHAACGVPIGPAMTGPEKAVEQAIMRALRSRGAVVVKSHGSAYSGAGVPDLVGVLPGGRALALEVKRPGGGASTPLQRRMIWAWAEAGAAAGIVRSVDEAMGLCGLD